MDQPYTRTFKQLDVWQTGMELAREVYRVTRQLPKSELYGLSSQLRRAAVSIPSNIAEGSGRMHAKEFGQFLSIAVGSLRETETLWILCLELDLVERSPEVDELIDKTGRMLNKMRSSVLRAFER